MYLGKIDVDILRLLKDIQRQNSNFIFDDRLFIEYGIKEEKCVLYGAFNFYETLEADVKNQERYGSLLANITSENNRWKDKKRNERFNSLCNYLEIPFFDIELTLGTKCPLLYKIHLDSCNNIGQKLIKDYINLSNKHIIKAPKIQIYNNNDVWIKTENWLIFLMYLRSDKNKFNPLKYWNTFNFKNIDKNNKDSLVYWMSKYHMLLGKGYYLTDIDAIIYSSEKCDYNSDITFIEFKSMKSNNNSDFKNVLYYIIKQYINPIQLRVYEQLMNKSYKKFNVNFFDIFYIKNSNNYYLVGTDYKQDKFPYYKYQNEFIEYISDKISIEELKNIIESNEDNFEVKIDNLYNILIKNNVDLNAISSVFASKCLNTEEFNNLLSVI